MKNKLGLIFYMLSNVDKIVQFWVDVSVIFRVKFNVVFYINFDI